MTNIEPLDRRSPVNVNLSNRFLKDIDELIQKSGNRVSRSQFIETIGTWYIEEREKATADGKRADIFSLRHVSDYIEDLENHIRLSDAEVARKLLPIISHAVQLAQNRTRKIKDISKITDRDPTEKIRLENTRKSHKFREAHEGRDIASDSDLVPVVVAAPNEIELLARQEEEQLIQKRKLPYFRLRKNENKGPNINPEIIEGEVPNPYGKGEAVFQ